MKKYVYVVSKYCYNFENLDNNYIEICGAFSNKQDAIYKIAELVNEEVLQLNGSIFPRRVVENGKTTEEIVEKLVNNNEVVPLVNEYVYGNIDYSVSKCEVL